MDGHQRDDLHMQLNDHATILADHKNRLNNHRNFVSTQMNHYMLIEERIDSLLDSGKSKLRDHYMYNHNLHSPYQFKKKQLESMKRPDYNITNHIRKQHEIQQNRKNFLGSYNPLRMERKKRKESLNQEWKNGQGVKKGGNFREMHMHYSPDIQNRKRFLRDQQEKKREERKRVFRMNPMSREIVERRKYRQYYHQNNPGSHGKKSVNRNYDATHSQRSKRRLSEPNLSSTSLYPFQKTTKKRTSKMSPRNKTSPRKNRILQQKVMDGFTQDRKPIFFDIPTPFPRSSKEDHLNKYEIHNGEGIGVYPTSNVKNRIIEELTTPAYMKSKKKRVKSHYRKSKTHKEVNSNKVFTFQPKINKNSERIVKEKRRRREKQFFSLLQDQRYLLLMKNRENERKTNKKRGIRARRRSNMRKKQYLNHSDSFNNLHPPSKYHNRRNPRRRSHQKDNNRRHHQDKNESEEESEEEELSSEEEESEEEPQQIKSDPYRKNNQPQQTSTSSTSSSPYDESRVKKKTVRTVRSNNEFYEKNRAWQNRLQTRILGKRKEKADNELSGCTFKPKINKFRREGMVTISNHHHSSIKSSKGNGSNNNDDLNDNDNDSIVKVDDDDDGINEKRTSGSPSSLYDRNYSRKIGYMKEIRNSRKRKDKGNRRRRPFSPKIKVKYIF